MTIESHEPPIRIIGLHDLSYCHRLFYLTEVEGLQAPNDLIYAGRELHASLAADEDGEQTQLELADPELGLSGKVDAIRRRDGSLHALRAQAGPVPQGRRRAGGLAVGPAPGDRLCRADRVVHRAARRRGPHPLPRRQRDRPRAVRRRGAGGAGRGDRHGAAAARVDRAAAGRRQRAALRPLLAGAGLPARGGPPGRGARPRAAPAVPARPRRHQPPRPDRRLDGRPQRRADRRPPARRRPRDPPGDPRARRHPDPRPLPDHDPGAAPLRRPRGRRALADDRPAATSPAPPPAPGRSSAGCGSTAPWPTRRPASAWPRRWPGARSRASTVTCSAPRAATRSCATRCSRTWSRSARRWRRSTGPATATRSAAWRARPPSATSAGWPG